MYGNSSPVESAQTGIHDQLAALVDRHARSEFRKPVIPYNQEAFDASIQMWDRAGQPPLILDAGCGVGLSSLHLAAQFADHFVIGVDQSAHRLSRNSIWPGPLPQNVVRVRANLVDYWRLMNAAGIRLARHYLLYPNPWPKIGHVARRWHGHPVFPALIALGGELECRSNWRIYIEECAAALIRLTGSDVQAELYEPARTITPFEQKYKDSGHSLWRCRINLGACHKAE
ncbi:SAM-dependent methyltransferase [Herbaspirillum sp. HC18]|nr:SAM-dependent methyltransferase [Herbaspirillum sp. HC18]